MPPNHVVKPVESASRVWPPRVPFGGMLMHALNSRLPATVERMRTGQIDRLPGQHMNGRGVIGCQRIVRQVHMEVERRHALSHTAFVQVRG